MKKNSELKTKLRTKKVISQLIKHMQSTFIKEIRVKCSDIENALWGLIDNVYFTDNVDAPIKPEIDNVKPQKKKPGRKKGVKALKTKKRKD